MEIILREKNSKGLSKIQITKALIKSISDRALKRVLILPPDFTRLYSGAGFITGVYYHELKSRGCKVDVMPALGTHEPMTRAEWNEMYPDIPYGEMLIHDYRNDTVTLGTLPSEFMSEITEGLWNEPVNVEVNRRILDPAYDLIISVGQVVPHVVAGMANHTKNLFVGAGGRDMINKTHMIGAVYGMERIMGREDTPVRRIFDYAYEMFLKQLPIIFVLTVNTKPRNVHTHGVFIGESRELFSKAALCAIENNITILDKPIKKCVAYMEPNEYRSMWVGNKAIYRTRMAIADGGELIVLAPGITKFGESEQSDALIRKYGYCGRIKVLDLYRKNKDLEDNMSIAAHLIHSSADERFKVIYATNNLTQEEIEGAGYSYINYDEACSRYDPSKLKYGYNTLPDGEEIFFVPNPALGLYKIKE